MKKTKVFVLLMVIVILSLAPCDEVIASEPDKYGIVNQINSAKEQREALLSQINSTLSELVSNKEISSYDSAKAIRVHTMDTRMLAVADETDDIVSTLFGFVQWKIPITTSMGHGVATLVEDNGEVSFAGFSKGAANPVLSFSYDSVKTAVEASDIITDNLISMEIGYSYLDQSIYVFLRDSANQYVVPYGTTIENYQLENGTVYLLSEVIEKCNQYYGESINAAENGLIGGGILQSKEPLVSSKTVLLMLAAAGAIAIGIAVVGIVIVRRKRNKK